MQLGKFYREIAIRYALKLGNTILAERLLPVGRCLLDYAAGCPRVEVIAWMLDCGYLRRDEHLAALAMPALASSGCLDLMQQVLHLHSPLPTDHDEWVNAWIDAIKEACSCGNGVVLQWLLDQSLGIAASDRIREEKEPEKLFLAAAEKGYVDVMGSLHSQRLAGECVRVMDKAVEEGRLNTIKWLIDHYPVEQLKARRVIDKAAGHGHVDVLQFFHDLDASGVEAAEAKRRRTTSWWASAEDPIYWAASGGHLAVLEWIQANRSQQCKADAMDIAAGQGRLQVVEWLHANRSEVCTYTVPSDGCCEQRTSGSVEVAPRQPD